MQPIGAKLMDKRKEFEAQLKRKGPVSLLVEQCGVRPTLYNPQFAVVSGDAVFGLFISYLAFWHDKGWDKDWMYKTIEEMEKETGLNRSQQDRAIKRWVELGVLEVKLEGMPPKRHFHLDFQKLVQLCLVDKSVPNLQAPAVNLQPRAP